jgi:WhiB family redox-sensing transcriptional regulator
VYATLEHQDLLDEPQPPAEPDWTKARCSDSAGTLTDLFFSEDLIDIARAKAICSKCVLAAPCLAGALERAEPAGVWGGHLLASGQIVLQKRRRGRPPKHPRPEPVVDEVIYPPYIVGRSA